MNIKLFSFDLKGSIKNRTDPIKQGKVLKCMNFVDINSSKKKLVRLEADQIEEMSDLIEKDSLWLREMMLMDYSLYLVIEQLTDKIQSAHRLENLSRNEYRSIDNQMIYHVGIIDFLTPWTTRKKVENYSKSKMKMVNQ